MRTNLSIDSATYAEAQAFILAFQRADVPTTGLLTNRPTVQIVGVGWHVDLPPIRSSVIAAEIMDDFHATLKAMAQPRHAEPDTDEGEPGLDPEPYTEQPGDLTEGVSGVQWIESDQFGPGDCVWYDHAAQNWAYRVDCSGRVAHVNLDPTLTGTGYAQTVIVCEAHFNAEHNPYHRH